MLNPIVMMMMTMMTKNMEAVSSIHSTSTIELTMINSLVTRKADHMQLHATVAVYIRYNIITIRSHLPYYSPVSCTIDR